MIQSSFFLELIFKKILKLYSKHPILLVKNNVLFEIESLTTSIKQAYL